ncbi:cytochrome b [Roseibacterium sp. SDUM158017]|uniref:cytochrome b n=1 Tax=Roseicyclus salinarum TaxID=3036773 RepID=UPI0024150656|nr:cytochrome b [Roseibacterium sp. SDUM158017]MDG4647784.1 cytochrome b [Roseibacterium sp. SDUM158017]
MTTTPVGYGTTARLFHWSMAVLVLATIPAGFLMVQEGLDRSLQNALFIFHKNVGVLLLILIVARGVHRLRRPAPPLPAGMPGWQVRVAGATHGALYGLLFVMPVAGYVRVKAGGFPIETLDAIGLPSLVPRSDALAAAAKAVHFYGALALAAVVALHVGAALQHAILRRDGVFSRMWPPVAPHRR